MKIVDKICQGGSIVTLPRLSEIVTNGRDMQVVYIGNAADKSLIGAFNIQADISQDMAYLSQVYGEAREILGITNAYQGREDTTATSGVAKRFAATQSAGRMESKRIMKKAAYALLFEAIFRFRLAYSDSRRPVVSHGGSGDVRYDYFDRYDFMEKNEFGEYVFIDDFIFAAEEGTSLASNRELMWEATRSNLISGAFGDPTKLDTLIMYWTKMDQLHYPMAKETRAQLEELRAKENTERTASLENIYRQNKEQRYPDGGSADSGE